MPLSRKPTAGGSSLFKEAIATYDFAVHGGDTGDKALGVTILSGAIVMHVWADVQTAVHALEDPDLIHLTLENSYDLMANGNYDPGLYSSTGYKACKCTIQTPSTYVLTTADRVPTLSVGLPLASGKIAFHILYI